MAEDLEMGTEQLAEMTANAEASMGAEANLSQELPLDAALEMGAAEQQAQNDTPASFDINSMVPGGGGGGGGNYGQPSAPQKPNVSSVPSPEPSDFLKAMNQVVDSNVNEIFVDRFAPKTLSEKINPIVGPKTRYAGQDLDMFRYQDDFDPQGFNYFNPEKQKGYIEEETWGSALGKGFDSFATRFGNTFTDHFASYGRIGEALINWDWDKIKYTESEMIEANFAEYKESMKNYVFVPPEEEDDIISKRSVSEFVGNAGFALGTFAGFGLELAADAVITAFTAGGGAGSFAATAARAGAKEAAMAGARTAAKGFAATAKSAAFRFTDFVADMGKGAYHFANQSTDALSVAGKVTQKANQAKNVANAGKVGGDALRASMKEVFDIYTLNLRNIVKSKSFSQLAGNIAKGVPILGTGIRYGEKVAAGVKGGLSTGKVVGIGLMGTRRMLQEFNMSSTEANFEAITGYGTTLDMMVNQYRADHDGENPSAAEFTKMETLALKSASSGYNTNLGILLVTNRFQFGSLFNRFAGANKLTKELLQEGAQGVLGVNRIWGTKELLGQVYQKGFFGTYGLLGKIGKDFGRKQALYEFGKQFSKDLLRFEVTEGLQENLQEMSGAAWKYYYAGQYNGFKYTIGQAFDKGLDEQFTKQGFRTFLQGALTGSMIRPVTHTVGKFTNYMNEKAMERSYRDNPTENPYVKMKEQLTRDINLQNDLMRQMSAKKFEDNIINFNNQVDSSLGQTEAAAKGHQYEWQNAKDNSVLSGVMAANRSGTTAMYQQALREMGKTMTNEEFESAFGIKLEDTKYNSAAEVTESMAKDVKKYTDTIDGIRKKVRNLPDPLMYEAGSKERLVSTIMHNAQEEAIRIVALNAMKATRASERAQSVSQELLKIPGFAGSSEYALRVLANPESFKGESGNMLSEIKLLEESLKQGTDFSPEQKKSIEEKLSDKKEILETYNKWFEFWDNRDQLLEREDSATGEKSEQKEKMYDTFTGVPFKAKEYDEDGVLINEETTVYSLDHKDAIETFRKFINLRNREAGITDQISEEDLRNAFDKVVDFIRLSQDQKDYMRSMDLLFNPEYYRQTITNIQDGRFKYEILELVDGLNDRLFNVIKYVVTSSDLEDPVEKLELAFKIFEDLSKTVTESDYYKNLVLIGIDENTGLQNAKFAQENLKKLNEVIEDKIAEILDSYASQEVTGDISDLEYEEFQKTKKVPGYVMSLLARKLSKEETLSDRQSEVYEANKDEVDAIIDRLNISKNTSSGMNDTSLVGVAKEKLVETGEYEMAQLDVMNENELLALAVQKNVITEEEVSEHFSGKAIEVISDEVYNEFLQTQEVEDLVLENIARRNLDDIELTEREQEIMAAKAAEISEIQSIIEDERIRNEEENAPVVESEEEVIPQVLEQEEDVEEKTTDTVGGTVSGAQAAADETNKLFETLYGTGKDGTNKEENEQEPFVVKGTEEEGFDVVSRNGITLNNKKIKSEKEAIELANKLNATRIDIDWSTKFLGDLSKDDEAQYKIDRMVNSGKKSLRAYNQDTVNKANETEITTLEEYYKIPEGKRNLNDIKESILTGVLLSKIKQNRKKAAKEEAEQLDLFDDTTSGFVGGPALPMQSVQDLYDRLEAASNQEGITVDMSAKRTQENKKIENLEFAFLGGEFVGSFLDNYEFVAQGSESTVYKSKDGTHVIKIAEPYSSKEEDLYKGRITDTLMREIIGNSGLEVVGYYEYKGVKNPVYRQNYIEGKVLSETEVGTYLKTIKGVVEISGKYYYKYNEKLYVISDFTDNVIKDKNGNIVPIDLNVYEITDDKINNQYNAKLGITDATTNTKVNKDISEGEAVSVHTPRKLFKARLDRIKENQEGKRRADYTASPEGYVVSLMADKANENDNRGRNIHAGAEVYLNDKESSEIKRIEAKRKSGLINANEKSEALQQVYRDAFKRALDTYEIVEDAEFEIEVEDRRSKYNATTKSDVEGSLFDEVEFDKIEDRLKQKTYQDVLNEKWPDTIGYLSTPLGNNLFNKEEGKFIEGKHFYEIRPIGNGKFEYRFINNKSSFNRALPVSDKYVKAVADELNRNAGYEDTIVTIQPGILRKEGTGFIVEKQAKVFYIESSNLNTTVKGQPKTTAEKLTAINDSIASVAQVMSQKNSKFVNEETVSEETILDQLRKINSCFK